MRSARARSIVGILLVGSLVAPVGCAGRQVPPPRLDAATRDVLGTVAVSWVDAPPRVDVYSTHSAGRGAEKGAGLGAQAGLPLLALGQVPNVAGAMVGLGGIGVSLAGALIGAPIGALVGATKAPSKAAVKDVTATFAAVTAPLDVGGCIGGRIHQTLRQHGSTWTVLAPIPPGPPLGNSARYRALAAQGVDTVIELGALVLTVSGPFGVHPEGSVLLTAPMRVVRLGDGAELLAHEFHWASPKESPPTPADPRTLGEMLEGACQDLARDVVRTVAAPGATRDDRPDVSWAE